MTWVLIATYFGQAYIAQASFSTFAACESEAIKQVNNCWQCQIKYECRAKEQMK